jgi:hypothetical protein
MLGEPVEVARVVVGEVHHDLMMMVKTHPVMPRSARRSTQRALRWAE